MKARVDQLFGLFLNSLHNWFRAISGVQNAYPSSKVSIG
jgi:hypothetical protein